MWKVHNRAAWMEVDLDALRNNCQIIRQHIGSERKLIAVVKADAYGHGVVQVVRALVDSGADMLAVASCNELLELRRAGIDAPVLVLGHVPPSAYHSMIEQGGQFTLYDQEQARCIDAAAALCGRKALVHIKVDTGMGRLGFLPQQAKEVAELLHSLPHLQIAGAFSHFALADVAHDDYVRYQQQGFESFLQVCQQAGLSIPLRHMANSAAICQWPQVWYDAVRAGIILYGCEPSRETPLLPGLRPTMSIHSSVVRLQWLPAGSFVSYGCTWQASRQTLVATLPIGYADGVPRLLSNRGQVLLCGMRAPIIGRVCMDQLMIDVTDIAAVHEVVVGSEAVLIGRQGSDQITAEEVADWAGTVNYEIVCGFRMRLEREYLPKPATLYYHPLHK